MIQFLIAEFPPEWRDLDPETFWSRVMPLLRIYVRNGRTRPIPSHAEWVPIDCLVDGNNVVVIVDMKED